MRQSINTVTNEHNTKLICFLAPIKHSGYVSLNEQASKIWHDTHFIFSFHVECVALLSKLKSDQHIEVELKTDEFDLTSAESKATYDEIKSYVKEHTGLTVSSLNIAQVKQKYGITRWENYNKEKSEDAKQPQFPPDKEKAIKEALRHFGMI